MCLFVTIIVPREGEKYWEYFAKPSSLVAYDFKFCIQDSVTEEGIEPSHLAVHDFESWQNSLPDCFTYQFLVPREGVEPSSLAAYDFESYVYTNSTTEACICGDCSVPDSFKVINSCSF